MRVIGLKLDAEIVKGDECCFVPCVDNVMGIGRRCGFQVVGEFDLMD